MSRISFQTSDISVFHTFDEKPPKYQMHTHTHAELFCFLRGEGTFHVEGSYYHLQPGDILLFRPGEAHYICLDGQQAYERIHVSFTLDLLSRLDPQKDLLRPFFDRMAGKQNLIPAKLFQNDAHMTLLKNMLAPGNTKATVTANLVLLLHTINGVFDTLPPPTQENETIEYQLIHYINNHIQEKLSLQELCDRFFLSRSQLCRRFQKATGTSVGKYIATKRLILAQNWIRQGQKPTDTASLCGYQDYSSFFRAYKAYFGYGPKEECHQPPSVQAKAIIN